MTKEDLVAIKNIMMRHTGEPDVVIMDEQGAINLAMSAGLSLEKAKEWVSSLPDGEADGQS